MAAHDFMGFDPSQLCCSRLCSRHSHSACVRQRRIASFAALSVVPPAAVPRVSELL